MTSELHNILVHIHSIGRWILLLLLLIAIFSSFSAGGRLFTKSDNKRGLMLTITADIMLIIGLILWYMGPFRMLKNIGMSELMGNNVSRFFAVEHGLGMIIAIILIHIGKAQGKKRIADTVKHKRTAVYYLIALIIILISIPWPFLNNGTNGAWF